MKIPKTFTVLSSPEKVISRIKELEYELKTTSGISRAVLKTELNNLYKLRKKQKNYTPPPKPLKLRGL